MDEHLVKGEDVKAVLQTVSTKVSSSNGLKIGTGNVIMDEPSSELDAVSEELIFDVLDRLVVSKTVVVIAHRLSTIRRAQRIIVIDDGQVVESGPHEQLLRLGGLYAKL